jgi:hypothetical protein
MQGNHLIVRAAIALTIAAAALAAMPSGAWAQGIPKDLADKLTPAQLATYETYRTARDRFERQLKIYWHRVEAKRDARKAKRMLGQEYEAEDYIAVQPPKYAGPELPPEIAKIVHGGEAAYSRAAAGDGRGFPGERERAIRLRADAYHRARVQSAGMPRRRWPSA